MANLSWLTDKKWATVFFVVGFALFMAALFISKQLPGLGAQQGRAEELANQISVEFTVAYTTWSGQGFPCDYANPKASLTGAATSLQALFKYLKTNNLTTKSDGTLWGNDRRLYSPAGTLTAELGRAMQNCPDPSDDIKAAWAIVQTLNK